MKGEVNQRFLLELGTACQMEHPQPGGCSKNHSRDVPQPYSTISLILLGLLRLIGLPRTDPGKSGRTRATPTKSGGSCGPDSGPVFHAPIRPHAGSLSSLLIPAGRLGSEALTRRRQALPLSLVYSRARRSE